MARTLKSFFVIEHFKNTLTSSLSEANAQLCKITNYNAFHSSHEDKKYVISIYADNFSSPDYTRTNIELITSAVCDCYVIIGADDNQNAMQNAELESQKLLQYCYSILTNSTNLDLQVIDDDGTEHLLSSFKLNTIEKIEYNDDVKHDRILKGWRINFEYGMDEAIEHEKLQDILSNSFYIKVESLPKTEEQEQLEIAERERIENERLNREKLKRKREEQQRLALLEQERLESERLAREEAKRLAEQERERIALEEQQQLEEDERQRLEDEKRQLELERIAREEQERLAEEERERLAEELEARIEQERLDRITIYERQFFNQNYTRYTIPDYKEIIEKEAFANNDFEIITIPKNVRILGEGVFANNPRLREITLTEQLFNTYTFGELTNRFGVVLYFTHSGEQLTSPTEIPENQYANQDITGDIGYRYFPFNLSIIGKRAFYNNQISNIRFPEELKSIGDEAFSNNLLTNISIPDSVVSIGDSAFANNPNLLTVRMSLKLFNSYTELELINRFGEQATFVSLIGFTLVKVIKTQEFFENLISGDASYLLPEGVVKIRSQALANNKISSITLPSTLVSIRDSAFENNYLTGITIPDNVNFIGRNAFANNPNLSRVIITQDLFNTFNVDDLINRFGENAYFITKDGTLLIPPKLKIIQNFRYANILDSVSISFPNSVIEIGDNAFSNNSALQEITLPPRLLAIGFGAFSIEVAKENTGVSEIIIPQSVNRIKDLAFLNHTNLTRVIMSERLFDKYTENELANKFNASVEYFDHDDNKLKKLSSISPSQYRSRNLTGDVSRLVPEGITRIKSSAFQNNRITFITLPSTLEQIESNAFANNYFTEITIPPLVDKLEPRVFADNPYLVKVILERTLYESFTEQELVERFGEDIEYFTTTGELLNPLIKIRDSKYLSKGFFGDGSYLIPDGVITIGNSAFRSNEFTFFTFPESLERIGERSFESNNLPEITLPENVNFVGTSAFANNPNLLRITMTKKLFKSFPTINVLNEIFGNQAEYFNLRNGEQLTKT